MKSSKGAAMWVLMGLWSLAGFRWLSDQAWPDSVSSVSSEARACAVGVVLAVAYTTVRKCGDPVWRKMIVLAAVGAALFAGQVVGVVLHGVAGDEYNRVAALCLVPIVVMVARSALASTSTQELWPGLAGLAGALLIFPLATGGTALGYTGLIVPVLLVGAACVVGEREMHELDKAWASAALLAGGAAGLGMLHWMFLRGNAMEAARPVWQPLLLDIPIMGLTALALVLAKARRYSASYLAIPLLTVAGGAVVMRPGWSWRLLAGIVLLAAGAFGLIRRIQTDTPGLGLSA